MSATPKRFLALLLISPTPLFRVIDGDFANAISHAPPHAAAEFAFTARHADAAWHRHYRIALKSSLLLTIDFECHAVSSFAEMTAARDSPIKIYALITAAPNASLMPVMMAAFEGLRGRER